jgi:hypothetical protein
MISDATETIGGSDADINGAEGIGAPLTGPTRQHSEVSRHSVCGSG